ncbi:MAG: hypothetical protein IKI58_09100 [Oscillospiraceae bacterium]|nr:hypothetical protein [Oscillospiraceae bacterium]
MNKSKKKGMTVNVIAQCILYISVAVFSVSNIVGINLPDAVVIILMILTVLTIPAFIYSYVKTVENDKE